MEFNFVRHLLRKCLLIALSLRYRIKITGLKEVQDANPELKGALILPNHPAQVDPILINCITVKVFNAQTLMSESYFKISQTINHKISGVISIGSPHSYITFLL